MKRFLLFLTAAVIGLFSCEREATTVPDTPMGGNDIPSTPVEETVADHEGNIYPIKKIGNQTWTTKNMCCKTLKDGTNIIASSSNQSSFTSPVGYHSNNGNLYNLLAAEEICPDGWHLPSRQEWNMLIGNSGYYAAKSLASTTGWKESNVAHTPGCEPYLNNSTGFNASPSGFGMNGGYSQGKGSYFWAAGICSNGYDGTTFYIYYNEIDVKRRDWNLDIGAAVRCVKD